MKPTCKTFLWLALVVLAGLASCKKDMETSADGKIIDRTTQVAIAQATIYFWVRGTGNISQGGYGSIKDSVFSDNKGEFSFNFEADENMSYSISGHKAKYMEMYGNPNPAVDAPLSIEKGEKNTTTLMLTPMAFIRIYVNNIYNSDEISIGDPCFSINCSITGPLTNYFVGIFTLRGNTKNFIKWFVYKNNIRTSYIDSIYCVAFDTTTFKINY